MGRSRQLIFKVQVIKENIITEDCQEYTGPLINIKRRRQRQKEKKATFLPN